jgi:hypothetical protein
MISVHVPSCGEKEVEEKQLTVLCSRRKKPDGGEYLESSVSSSRYRGKMAEDSLWIEKIRPMCVRKGS